MKGKTHSDWHDRVNIRLARHIFSEPGPAVRIDVDADADVVQGCAEEVDAVPATQRFTSHAFLNGVDIRPGGIGWPGAANIFAAVTVIGKAFIGDALAGRTAVGTVVAEAAVVHVPAMQERARSQGGVPGERGQAAGGAVAIDQLEELLGELLRFCGDGGRAVGSGQRAVLCRGQGFFVTVGNTV